MDRAYVAAHLEEDRGHWWFRGRRAVLLATLRLALPPGPHRLELGCGSGNVLEALGRFGEGDVRAILERSSFYPPLVLCLAGAASLVLPVEAAA